MCPASRIITKSPPLIRCIPVVWLLCVCLSICLSVTMAVYTVASTYTTFAASVSTRLEPIVYVSRTNSPVSCVAVAASVRRSCCWECTRWPTRLTTRRRRRPTAPTTRRPVAALDQFTSACSCWPRSLVVRCAARTAFVDLVQLYSWPCDPVWPCGDLVVTLCPSTPVAVRVTVV